MTPIVLIPPFSEQDNDVNAVKSDTSQSCRTTSHPLLHPPWYPDAGRPVLAPRPPPTPSYTLLGILVQDVLFWLPDHLPPPPTPSLVSWCRTSCSGSQTTSLSLLHPPWYPDAGRPVLAPRPPPTPSYTLLGILVQDVLFWLPDPLPPPPWYPSAGRPVLAPRPPPTPSYTLLGILVQDVLFWLPDPLLPPPTPSLVSWCRTSCSGSQTTSLSLLHPPWYPGAGRPVLAPRPPPTPSYTLLGILVQDVLFWLPDPLPPSPTPSLVSWCRTSCSGSQTPAHPLLHPPWYPGAGRPVLAPRPPPSPSHTLLGILVQDVLFWLPDPLPPPPTPSLVSWCRTSCSGSQTTSLSLPHPPWYPDAGRPVLAPRPPPTPSTLSYLLLPHTHLQWSLSLRASRGPTRPTRPTRSGP
ncbi:uncharacterized protein [Littorina saxatilis]|uniref:uncharacterized protein n=1 Tax=Littorina saxatilis TaxID=31220 RepID=UPI0038B5BE2B